MKKAFTLVELLVVVGMIAVLMGAMTVSVKNAQNRGRTSKATQEATYGAVATTASSAPRTTSTAGRAPRRNSQCADGASR